MQLPYASTAASRRAAIVSTGVKWALVLLVILNLLQLNLLYFSSQGSTRCILKAALATRPRVRSGLAASPAASEIMLPGSPLGSSVQLDRPMASHLQKTKSSRYALFVIYTWNREVLYTAVRSYAAAGFSKDVIILDNTDNSTLRDDPVIAELVAEVIPTRTVLTFSQAQNFMAEVAIERGYEYYFWGHADVAVLAKDESASFADDVIACVESSFKSRPKWGVIYFHYDWFSAIRTDLVRQVKYDTFVTVYMSDCDFYPRVRAAGFETLNYPQMCPSTYVEVYDVNAPLDIPWKDFGHAKAALEAHQRSGSSHFDWKLDAQSIGEKVGWELWERSSYMYFVAKWGPRQEDQGHCKIEVDEPITGNPALPQKPFGNLAYLQRFWVQEDPYYEMVPILAGLGRNKTDVPMPEWYKVEDEPEAFAPDKSPGAESEEALKYLRSGQDVEVISTEDPFSHKQAGSDAAQASKKAASMIAGGALIDAQLDASSAGEQLQGPLQLKITQSAQVGAARADSLLKPAGGHDSFDTQDEELNSDDFLEHARGQQDGQNGHPGQQDLGSASSVEMNLPKGDSFTDREAAGQNGQLGQRESEAEAGMLAELDERLWDDSWVSGAAAGQLEKDNLSDNEQDATGLDIWDEDPDGQQSGGDILESDEAEGRGRLRNTSEPASAKEVDSLAADSAPADKGGEFTEEDLIQETRNSLRQESLGNADGDRDSQVFGDQDLFTEGAEEQDGEPEQDAGDMYDDAALGEIEEQPTDRQNLDDLFIDRSYQEASARDRGSSGDEEDAEPEHAAGQSSGSFGQRAAGNLPTGLEAAETLLEQSLELDSKPQADRDNGHSGGTTQRADSGQQSRAGAAGGEDSLSAKEEPDAEEKPGQLPQDLQWDKVAAAEAREDDYTGSGDDAELDEYVDSEDADAAADEAVAEYWDEGEGEGDAGVVDAADPGAIEDPENAQDFRGALTDPDLQGEMEWLQEQDA